MSYLHCPTCEHAYNLAREPACPRCHATAHGAPAPTRALAQAQAPAPLSPTAEIVACAVALARALRRATPAERDAARASLHLIRDELGPRPLLPARAALAPAVRFLRRPTILAAAVVSLLARVTL